MVESKVKTGKSLKATKNDTNQGVQSGIILKKVHSEFL